MLGQNKIKSGLFIGVFLAILISIVNVSAIVYINETSTNNVVSPGNIAYSNFHIVNTANAQANVSISGGTFTCGTDSSKQLNASNIPTNVIIGANSTYLFQTNILTQSNTFNCIYSGFILSNSPGSSQDVLTANINVTAAPNLLIANTSATFITNLTQSGVLNINLANTGNTNLNLNYNYTNFVSGSNTLQAGSAGSKYIPYGSSDVIQIPFSIPSNQPAGTYTSTLTISGDVSRSVTLQVTVRNSVLDVSLPSVVFPSVQANNSVSTTFTIQNIGDYTLNGVSLATHANQAYNVTFSNVPVSLAPGQSATISVNAFIPANEVTSQHKIGNIIFNSDMMNKSSELDLNVQSMLKINEVDVNINGKSFKESSATSINDQNTMPGLPFGVSVNVCNEFMSSSYPMRDVTIGVTFSGVDNGNDMTGSVDSFTLSADKCVTKDVRFDNPIIPFLVGEGTYNLNVNVNGNDINGETHSNNWTLPINIYRDSNPNIKIANVTLFPSDVSCGDSTTLNLLAYNIGDSNNAGVLSVRSDSLGLNIVDNFETGSDISNDCDAIANPNEQCIGIDHAFSFNVPQNITPGIYPIDVTTYYGKIIQSDRQSVDLNVSCGYTPTLSQSQTTASSQQANPVVFVPTSGPSSSSTGAIATRIVDTTQANPKELVILVAGIVVVLLILAYLLSMLFR